MILQESDKVQNVSPTNAEKTTPRKTAPSSRGTGLTVWQSHRVIAHIEANLGNALRVSDLCLLVGLGSSHFSMAFRIRVGRSLRDYILSRRVEKAKSVMLADTGQSLALVAADCGLADQAHFCRMFKKQVGETPGNWRRRHLSNDVGPGSSPRMDTPPAAISSRC
jgi:AraC family transcriptional regulator